jgi:hypothetical protein
LCIEYTISLLCLSLSLHHLSWSLLPRMDEFEIVMNKTLSFGQV